jgi:thioredoxin reductase
METSQLPVAIIGGGPVGLAAAAHLIKRNQPFILFESGKTICANILNWGHVKVFSPWEYNIDKASEELLLQTNWESPNKEIVHTGREFYDGYLAPLANLAVLKPFIHTDSKIIAVNRKNMDKMKTSGRNEQPFVLQVQQGERIRFFEARAVIDASGTWQNGNPLGAGGLFALGELENATQIYYGIPDVTGRDKERYKNKSTLVVGGGHSAINTILELNNLKEEFPETQIHWVLRKDKISDIYGGQTADALEARGDLGTRIETLINKDRVSVYTPFQLEEIQNTNGTLTLTGSQSGTRKALIGIEEIISNTGTRPDFSFSREVRIDYDSTVESVPELAELIDPNIHSCGTVRPHGEKELRQKERDYYIVGMKSYGRAPTFLMATGYEQVRSVVSALVGDWTAARNVELNLPETGVCSSNPGIGLGENESCGTQAAGAKMSCCS